MRRLDLSRWPLCVLSGWVLEADLLRCRPGLSFQPYRIQALTLENCEELKKFNVPRQQQFNYY